MQVPKDQGLFFTVFVAICVAVTLGGWLALPVHIKAVIEGQEEAEEETASHEVKLDPAVTPEERIRQMEKILALAEATVAELEQTGSNETELKKKGSSP